MTNTKFRKRALLSSVAMLIVAMLALGSATFAWYQAQPTAEATGMTFKTSAASGLQIVSASVVTGSADPTDSDVWVPNASSVTATTAQLTGANAPKFGDSTTFNKTSDALQPASFNHTSKSYYTGDAAEAGVATYSSGAKAASGTTYVLQEAVYFRMAPTGTTNSGTVALDSVSFTDNKTAMADAVRVVVTTLDGATVIGEFKPGSTTDNAADQLDGSGIAATKKTVYGADAAYDLTATTVTATRTGSDTVGFLVSVYLDGFEEHVYSSNAYTIAEGSDSILNGISVSFKLTSSTSV